MPGGSNTDFYGKKKMGQGSAVHLPVLNKR